MKTNVIHQYQPMELEMEMLDDSSNANSSSSCPTQPAKRKKRNLPGMPDPDAEVIALSPKTLMATNRFVCEICSKGFQRDQNLQLHRRGHNLPWKLRQRSTADVRKRVYVCPEPSCVHHNPCRALGDLTGIKKHFSRKHGEKKWKCDKCSKKYAVQSDWKAHFKTCGTRDYTCDCGTVFSRRDSFITHRAFCDALAQESAKLQNVVASSPSPPPPPPLHSADVVVMDGDSLSVHSQNQNREFPEFATGDSCQIPPSTCINGSSGGSSKSSSSNSLFANVFGSSTICGSLQPQPSSFSDIICALALPERAAGLAPGSATEHTSLSLSSNRAATLFDLEGGRQFAPPPQPTMSATALLQKAAQMGAAATGGTFLRGLGVSLSSSSGQQEHLQWSSKLDGNPAPAYSGHGLGVPISTNSKFTELMMTPSSLFGSEPTTLDFLGLGMGVNDTSRGGLTALLTSIGGDLDITQSFRNEESLEVWKEEHERKTD